MPRCVLGVEICCSELLAEDGVVDNDGTEQMEPGEDNSDSKRREGFWGSAAAISFSFGLRGR